LWILLMICSLLFNLWKGHVNINRSVVLVKPVCLLFPNILLLVSRHVHIFWIVTNIIPGKPSMNIDELLETRLKDDRQRFYRKWVKSSFEQFITTQTRVGSTNGWIISQNAEIFKFYFFDNSRKSSQYAISRQRVWSCWVRLYSK